MIKKKDLLEKINYLETFVLNLRKIHIELDSSFEKLRWSIENPPKYKKGDLIIADGTSMVVTNFCVEKVRTSWHGVEGFIYEFKWKYALINPKTGEVSSIF